MATAMVSLSGGRGGTAAAERLVALRDGGCGGCDVGGIVGGGPFKMLMAPQGVEQVEK